MPVRSWNPPDQFSPGAGRPGLQPELAAQFLGPGSRFETLDSIAGWAAGLGYRGLQIPTGDPQVFDLAKAAESQVYCDEVRGVLTRHGLEITELSTHLQGQLIAVHPAYDELFGVNVKGCILGAKAALPELMKTEGSMVFRWASRSVAERCRLAPPAT